LRVGDSDDHRSGPRARATDPSGGGVDSAVRQGLSATTALALRPLQSIAGSAEVMLHAAVARRRGPKPQTRRFACVAVRQLDTPIGPEELWKRVGPRLRRVPGTGHGSCQFVIWARTVSNMGISAPRRLNETLRAQIHCAASGGPAAACFKSSSRRSPAERCRRRT
jgi:hypothetical protein